MSKKLWKANIIISMILFAVLLAIGTTLLVISSQGTPSSEWINPSTGEYYVKDLSLSFDGSTMYLAGSIILAISFLFFGFLFINYFIRKSMIRDLKKEKDSGEIKTNIKKYGFLLAHVLPYTKKQKAILEGIL